MFKYGFTEFGKDVKKRLIDLDNRRSGSYRRSTGTQGSL